MCTNLSFTEGTSDIALQIFPSAIQGSYLLLSTLNVLNFEDVAKKSYDVQPFS